MPRLTKAEDEKRKQHLIASAQHLHDVWCEARAKQAEINANRTFLEQQLQAIAAELRAQQRIGRDAAVKRNIYTDDIRRSYPELRTWKPKEHHES